MSEPKQLEHGPNCGYWSEHCDADCTCGLKFRIQVQTEQSMRAAWEKRAYQAESELAAALAERDALAAKVDAAAKYIHELRSYPQTIHPKLHAAAVAYYELTPDTEAT